MTENIYLRATKEKLRFSIPGTGKVSVEDLWDISIQILDQYAVQLSNSLDSGGVNTFLKNSRRRDPAVASEKLRLAIAVDILNIREESRIAQEKRAADKERRSKILEIMERKQDQELEGKTLDELRSLLDPSEDSEQL